MTATALSDRLVWLLIALALNALFTGPLRFWQALRIPAPARFIDAAVRYLEAKFNRDWRSESDLRMRGLILTLLLLGVAWSVGLWCAEASRTLSYGAMADIAFLMFLLPLRRLFDERLGVERALSSDNLEQARQSLRGIARRNIGQLDNHAIARTAIESLMDNFSVLLVTPILFYLVFGLPGLTIAWLANRLEITLGARSLHQKGFDWAAATFNAVLKYIPARIAGSIIALAASLVPKGNWPRAFMTMAGQAHRFQSTSRGWPVAATAGALGLTLGGPRSIHLTYIDDPWVGTGSVKATTRDLRRALYLYIVSAGLLCFLLALGSYGIGT